MAAVVRAWRITMKCGRLLGVAIAGGLSTAGAAQAGPITFLTALPVAQSQAVIRGQYLRISASDDRTPADRDLSVDGVSLAVAVGVTPRLALFGIVPILNKSIHVNTQVGRVTRDTTGLGDVVAFVRYTIYALDRADSTLRIAPFGGVKLPTGDDDDSDALGPLPRPLQLGSGSWDGLGGIAVTWQTKQWELDADVAYKRNTEADGFRLGHEFSTDLSLQYRVWPRQLGGGVPGFLFAVVETNLVSQRRNEIAGLRDPDSGGTRWDIDLGLQYVTARYILEGIVQIPTVDRPNGTGLGSDFRLTAGFRWNVSLPL